MFGFLKFFTNELCDLLKMSFDKLYINWINCPRT